LNLPDGAKRYSFSLKASAKIIPYLASHLPSWLDYLKDLQAREDSPPILLTAVWVAKRFACATYTGKPSSKSPPKAELLFEKSDKVRWLESVDRGFVTTVAPMDEGYDSEGRLRSKIENQCFGVEGFVFRFPK
jgi:hypothetical protein